MTAQPLAATAISLIREAMRRPPAGLDEPPPATPEGEADLLARNVEHSAEWAAHLHSAVGHLDDEARLSLIGLLAELGSWLAAEDDPQRRSLLLAMLAGEAEAD